MAILKRILCKGEEEGKRCRKRKKLNEDGLCDKYSNAADNDEKRCGMCGIKIHCDEWFHAACTGSKEYVEYIGREAPTGKDHGGKGDVVVLFRLCYKKVMFLKI